ncbi:MAG: tetratricopeptide repeat protein, partial [Bacteroidia bacterium]|nr:tetratricopeptide repeat protein [Bacteroidia bacterium]
TIHIVKDFIKGDATEKSYRIYDPARGDVYEKSYTRIGEEELELAGATYQCLVLEEMNPSLGVKAKQWFDIASGLNVQTIFTNRKIFLADPSVVKRITTVNMDDILFARVNTKISNIHGIEYMKVKGIIESAGEELTPESLNHLGQTFIGTVTDNVIEGIFEMTAEKYDGTDAPPFPPDFTDDPELEKFLKPENLIESDEPVLIEKAKEITSGSSDSWEAAKRLSKWVAENIEGAVPGGTSAINTYKIRQGECGSHSRLLAAFCRAVGIPARLAAGCMYSSLYGGSFGQHAWTEVYMGDAGWIPVDATAFEIDFIDAGHIRLGIGTSFNPKEMEILEYRMAEGKTDTTGNAIPVKFQSYLGKYTDLTRNRVFTVIYQDNSIGVDIPGQMILTLNEPDDNGFWYPQITRQLYFQFPKNTVGKVEKLLVTQMVPIPRKGDFDTIPADVPDSLLPYIGVYDLPQAQITLNVSYEDGALAIPDLIGRTSELILLYEDGDVWTSGDGKYVVKFEKNDEGNVARMVVSITFVFNSGEPAAFIIEKIIDEEGIEAAIERYNELKASNRGEYIFKEGLMNTVGYRLLGKDKFAEAIEIFKLNVSEHPGSFNAYDSLGEVYMKNGDTELAIRNYQKSLELNPENENGKKMLEKLQSGE